MSGHSALVEVIAHLELFLFLILTRLVAFVAFVRLFAPFSAIGQNVILQSVIALAMALPLFPDIIVALPATDDGPASVALVQMLASLVAGASFAVLCSVPIRIAAAVGEVVDNARGLSANGPLNPVTRDDATPLSSAVTATLSLIVFTFDWHLDILQDLYQFAPTTNLKALAETVRGTAPLWVQSANSIGVLLSRTLPLLGLLFTVDVVIAFAVKNLKSSDMGGAENTIKILIVAAWLVFLLQGLLSPQELSALRALFHGLVSPLQSRFRP